MNAMRYASEFDSSGYAIAARRCFNALVNQGLDPSWEALVEIAGYGRSRTAVAVGAPIELRARRRPIEEDELAIFHCVPQSWQRLREEIEPQHVIGHVVWECEQIPSRWQHELSAADELWVPTEWNRKSFTSVFSGPIHVVPHVVNQRPSAPPPITIAADRPVVAIVSAWDWRKRPDRTIEAAITAFAGHQDVVIVVKTTKVPIGWPSDQRAPIEQIAEIVHRHSNAPTVIVDDSDWSDAEILGLIERADCFFSMTCSEGWGLGAFDAATRGTPVVITGFGGQVEWLGADHAGLIPYSLVPVDHPDTSLFEKGMQWASAHFDEAVDLVRMVINDANGKMLETTRELAAQLCGTYSEETVGAHLAEIVQPLLVVDSCENQIDIEDAIGTQNILVLTPILNGDIDMSTYVGAIKSMITADVDFEVVIGVVDKIHSYESLLSEIRSLGLLARVEKLDAVNESSLRNRLLFAALADHDWVLWLDTSVMEISPELIKTTKNPGADILQPVLVNETGATVASTASTDRDHAPLGTYRGFGAIHLHSIDARIVLVRADCHREGLMWPAVNNELVNPRARRDPAVIGRSVLGELETEGLGLLAGAMGYTVLGVPDIEIIHE